MKSTFFFLGLFTTTILNAQDFGYKKGVISVDKNEVAKFEQTVKKEKKSEYIVSSMGGKPLIKLNEHWIGADAYYKLTFLEDSSTADMRYELMTFTLNMDKSIAMQLVKMYKLFDKNGLDSIAVNKMTSSEKAKAALALKNKPHQDSINNIIAQKHLMVKQQDLTHTTYMTITSNGNIVGYVEAPDAFSWAFNSIRFYDATDKRNLVGESIPEQKFLDAQMHDGRIKMRDGKIIDVRAAQWTSRFDEKVNAVLDLVKLLASEGYY